MTRKEHLAYCKICHHQQFSPRQGVICSITMSIASFEEKCEFFSTDRTAEIPRPSEDEIILNLQPQELRARAKEKLTAHQNLPLAIAGGLFMSLLVTALWVFIAISINFQFGYLALALGFAVGRSVLFFGQGLTKRFGILAAFLAFVGCVLANVLSQVGFIANARNETFLETIHLVEYQWIMDTLKHSFAWVDLLFYAIAVYEAYYFSMRKTSALLINKFNIKSFSGSPAGESLRVPLVIVAFVLVALLSGYVINGKNSFKYNRYPSGRIMSQGMLKHSKPDGQWKYFSDNGYMESIGNYRNGKANGAWTWYNSDGQLIKYGYYSNGLEHGSWVEFYNDGQTKDSCTFVNGRTQGYYESYYPTGQLLQCGFYHQNELDSTWKVYYENGQLSSLGIMEKSTPSGYWTNYYENGQIREEVFYVSADKLEVLNTWGPNGEQLVTDGNGTYKFYSPEGLVLQEGTIKNKKRTGIWKYFSVTGQLMQEARFEQDEQFLINTWDQYGDQHVINGYGTYKTYFDGGKTLSEYGKVKNGVRIGKWKTFFQGSGNIQQEIYYENGKLNGKQTIYYENGQVLTTGLLKDGKKEGEWNWYYETGEPSSTAMFVADKKQGLQIMWSEWGYKTKEETYQYGELEEEVIL